MKKKLLITIPILLILFSVLFAQTGRPVRIWDTNSTHVTTIKWNENDTSNRTFNLTLNSGDRTFALHANLTVEATSLIDQDLTTDSAVVQFLKLGIGAAVGAYDFEVTGTSNFGGAVTGIAFSEIENPTGNIQFNMTTRQIRFLYTNPAVADGGFEIEASGAFSGDLVHIHQHTGNPSTVDLMHLKADDTDVLPLRVEAGNASTEAINIVGFTTFGGDLVGGTNELTIGSINRGSGTLTLEIGGVAQLSMTNALAHFTAKLGIGTATIPHGGIGGAKFAIEGVDGNVATGPHLQFTTDTDDYPLIQILNWQHDNMSIFFDSYHDGDEKSSDAGSNYIIQKTNDLFRIRYDSGIAQGAALTWNDGIVLNTSGDVEISTGDLSIKSQNELRFYDNGNYVGFEAPALSANQIWKLPSSDGGSNEVLTTNGTGTLTWSVKGGGGAATDVYKTINVPAGSDPVASGATDTLNLTSSSGNLTITGDSGADTVDFDFSLTPTFTSVSLGTGELTAGSINRASGTLTLEVGGTAEISITSTTSTFGGDIVLSGTVDGVDVSTLGSAVSSNTTHRGSDGSDHSFINQNVTTTGTPSFTSVSLGTGELTAGSINRASGTLTLEIGGTAEVSITSTLTTFGGAILADTARLSDLTDGYIPYHVSDVSGLANSVIFQSGANIGIGVTPEDMQADHTAIRIGPTGGIFAQDTTNDVMTITNNIYRDVANSRWEYIEENPASDYYQTNGTHNFRVGGAEIADTAYVGTTVFKIDNDGVLTSTQNSDTLTITGDGTDFTFDNSDGDIIFSDPVGIGTTVPHGGVGTADFAIDSGTPSFQMTDTADDYPVFGFYSTAHDDVRLYFDSYYDGAERSSDAGSNYMITKGLFSSDLFEILYSSGNAQGATVTWTSALVIDTSGNVYIRSPNAELRFYEGVNWVGFEAPDLNANQIWVLPSADGNNSEVLTTNGSGVLSWSANSFPEAAMDEIAFNAAEITSNTALLTANIDPGHIHTAASIDIPELLSFIYNLEERIEYLETLILGNNQIKEIRQ